MISHTWVTPTSLRPGLSRHTARLDERSRRRGRGQLLHSVRRCERRPAIIRHHRRPLRAQIKADARMPGRIECVRNLGDLHAVDVGSQDISDRGRLNYVARVEVYRAAREPPDDIEGT